MAISSITSTSVQQVPLTQTKSEGVVEGNKPDGDGDKDDVTSANSVAQTNNIAQVTESLGNNVNLIV